MALTTVDLPCATCPIVPAIDQGGGWVGRGGAMARVRQRGAWRGGGREARVARRIERRTMMIGSLTLRPSSRAIGRSIDRSRRGERSRGRTDVDRRLARDDLRRERRQRARVERLRVLHGEPVVADDVAHGERSLDARRRRLFSSRTIMNARRLSRALPAAAIARSRTEVRRYRRPRVFARVSERESPTTRTTARGCGRVRGGRGRRRAAGGEQTGRWRVARSGSQKRAFPVARHRSRPRVQ